MDITGPATTETTAGWYSAALCLFFKLDNTYIRLSSKEVPTMIQTGQS